MTLQKKVDESWKDSVQKERTGKAPQAVPAESAAQESTADFLSFISTLVMQTMMCLGEMVHPETGQAQTDLQQARYLVDVIQLLSDKTKGNLTPQEDAELQNILYELRVKFVKKSQGLS